MNKIRDGDVRKMVYVLKRICKEFLAFIDKIEKGEEVDPVLKRENN